MMHKPVPSRTRIEAGFTLVEVLVAVAIVALAVTALLMAMMRQIDGTGYLREKMIAHWVALNQMELAVLTNNASNQVPQAALSGSEEMAGQTWYWRGQPKATTQPGAVQLDIDVSKLQKDGPSVAHLMVILDSFHKLP